MKKDNKGFSLVELIIVIAIMAVLIGLLAPQYLKFVKKSKVSADVSNAQALATAFNVAFADGVGLTGTYTGAKGTDCAGGSVNAQWPESKLVPTASFVVHMNSNGNGVEKITLGGSKVWPTTEGSWSSN